MAVDPVKNFAIVDMSTGYDASATSIVVASGGGAKFPAPATDGSFNLVWWNDTDYPRIFDDPNLEVVRCTARSTDMLTVTRGQEGTSASTKNTSAKTYKIGLMFTALMYNQFAQKGANGDITSITGLTTPLSAAQGGTGYAGTVPSILATMSATQSVAHATWTKVNFDTETRDTGNYYDTTNKRWTPPAGTYWLWGQINSQTAIATTKRITVQWRKNNVAVTTLCPGDTYGKNVAYDTFPGAGGTITLNGSDYMELFIYQDTGSSITLYNGTAVYITGFLIAGA